MVCAVIAAPFLGLAISLVTFFTCVLAFVEGVHCGLKKGLFGKIEEKKSEPNDIWEKHINRMKK